MNHLRPAGDGPDFDIGPDPAADAALEAELGAMRPNELPAALSLRLRRGVVAGRRMQWLRRAAPGLAACLALAAAIAVALAVRHTRRIVHVPPPATAPGSGSPVEPAPRAGPRPVTLAVYRNAVARSPEALDALDALLDAEARRPWPGGTTELVAEERVGVLD